MRSLSIWNLFLTPDRDFWEKTKFFSEPKQSVVNKNDYQH